MKYQIYAMFHQHQFHVLLNLLDFISFQEFKNACLNTLDISKTDYSPKVIKANKNDVKEILQHYTNRVINNIQFSYDHLDFEQLDSYLFLYSR